MPIVADAGRAVFRREDVLPSLSAIVPTFRRTSSLGRTLTALRSQDLPGIEILVVDQNAPGYLAEALGTNALDGTVHLSQHEANASGARNFGFSRSRGDWVLFIDDDMVPPPDFARRAMERAKQLPEVRCLIPLWTTDAELQRPYPPGPTSPQGGHPIHADLVRALHAMSGALFFERAMFRATGGFDEVLFRHARAGEDHELFTRMALRGLHGWLDRSLRVYHDDHVPGGAEMRTIPHRDARARAALCWAIRERMHAPTRPALGLPSMIRLVRSAFLNSAIIRIPPADTLRNVAMLRKAVADSRKIVADSWGRPPSPLHIDHLGAYAQVIGAPPVPGNASPKGEEKVPSGGTP